MSFEGRWDHDKSWDEWIIGIVMWPLILVLEGGSIWVFVNMGLDMGKTVFLVELPILLGMVSGDYLTHSADDRLALREVLYPGIDPKLLLTWLRKVLMKIYCAACSLGPMIADTLTLAGLETQGLMLAVG